MLLKIGLYNQSIFTAAKLGRARFQHMYPGDIYIYMYIYNIICIYIYMYNMTIYIYGWYTQLTLPCYCAYSILFLGFQVSTHDDPRWTVFNRQTLLAAGGLGLFCGIAATRPPPKSCHGCDCEVRLPAWKRRKQWEMYGTVGWSLFELIDLKNMWKNK